MFYYDGILRNSTIEFFGNLAPFHNRLAQIYAESAFNARAVSDFGGWRKAGLDTASAILQRKGAAGLCQFIWPTAKDYGAMKVEELFDPWWAVPRMCRYMRDIKLVLARTKNPDGRRRLQVDRQFMEYVTTASYNTGQGRILDRMNRHGDSWETIKGSILPEPREYAEKIWRLAETFRNTGRWALVR